MTSGLLGAKQASWWQNLNRAEQVVAALIALMPLTWVVGAKQLPLLLGIGLAVYEIRRHGTLQLKRPGWMVGAVVAFGVYRFLSETLWGEPLSPSGLLSLLNTWVLPGFLLWYFQSRDIRVRPEIVAWSCLVLVGEMLLLWAGIHFVLGEPAYAPPLSLFGLLLGKGEQFFPGGGIGNFLHPYWPNDRVFGLARFGFFFGYPESFAVVMGFIALLFLDRKLPAQPLLLGACLFLLVLSGTRSAWLALPLVLAVRTWFTAGQVGGRALPLALVALVSFIALSVPPVTELVLDTVHQTAQATDKFRPDSSEVRGRIYTRTLERLGDEWLFGHGVPGPTVLPRYKPAALGTHSFVLGTLLYRSGAVGTALFVLYWLALAGWLYRTRAGRPPCALLAMLYISLVLLTKDFEVTEMLVLVLVALLREREAVDG
ncbi:O-antigen ligase family protein [Anthocerotibacter panamensis]|uniref:O-antigen ligase family protein n=1 Tax=Anthocerotibacter panamensis TaxID=2857077 RepID=UPI001C407CB6|nr:O-antigen ligase family protein [Anthocerotibacter panamensis]